MKATRTRQRPIQKCPFPNPGPHLSFVSLRDPISFESATRGIYPKTFQDFNSFWIVQYTDCDLG